jgi:hypothetical protein
MVGQTLSLPVGVLLCCLAAGQEAQKSLDPPDAAPKTRVENGRVVYQIGETVFAFRISKSAWKDAAEGVYLEAPPGKRLLIVASGRSVRYEDAIEAQSRAIGLLRSELTSLCADCRLANEVYGKFERWMYLDTRAGGIRVLLAAQPDRLAMQGEGRVQQNVTPLLVRRLEKAGRLLKVE